MQRNEYMLGETFHISFYKSLQETYPSNTSIVLFQRSRPATSRANSCWWSHHVWKGRQNKTDWSKFLCILREERRVDDDGSDGGSGDDEDWCWW